jgi:hypothetical protein
MEGAPNAGPRVKSDLSETNSVRTTARQGIRSVSGDACAPFLDLVDMLDLYFAQNTKCPSSHATSGKLTVPQEKGTWLSAWPVAVR